METIQFVRLCKFASFAVSLVLSLVLYSPVRAVAEPASPPSTPTVTASGPVNLGESSLYDGEDIDSAPFTSSSWGAGTIDTVDYPGLSTDKKALKIMTYGPYEGALLTFTTPGVLGNIKADKTRFLVIVVSITSPSSITGAEAFPFNPLLHLAQNPMNPRPMPSMPNGSTPKSGTQVQSIPRSNQSLRLVFTLTNGISIDTMRDIPVIDPANPWIEVGIPLANLPLTDAQVQGAQLQSLMIAGDRTGTIYISKMSLISDSTPIRAEIEGSRDIDLNSYMSYTAHASGGPTNLSYAWKFGDDGSTPTGRIVSHKFRTAGDFKVSVTVLDADGLKPGVMVTTSVHVEAP